MSVNATNPGTLFGGSWEQITGRFLLAAGGGYSAGTTGGEAAHKLTVTEMPAHTHTYFRQGLTTYGQSGSQIAVYDPNTSSYPATSSTGGNSAHNNMPPYLVVYIWKRTA